MPARFPYDRLNGSLDRLNGPLAAIQLLREITRGKESISAEFQGSADKFQPSTRMHSQVKKKVKRNESRLLIVGLQKAYSLQLS